MDPSAQQPDTRGGDLPPTAVVMPVYNEAAVVRRVIAELVELGLTVIAVDDGSSDDSAAEIDAAGAIRVSHPINLGQGGALQTGFTAALRFTDAKYVATFDADGQHQAQDLLGMIAKAQEGYDVVLGSRFLDGKTEMSGLRRLILKTATKVLNRRSSTKLTDAHNGLRVLNRPAAEGLRIRMNGMAHASEIVGKLARSDWRVAEIPVTILYTDYSRAKGQSLVNGVNILFELSLRHRGV